MWSVYIVRCSDSTLYCGISNSLSSSSLSSLSSSSSSSSTSHNGNDSYTVSLLHLNGSDGSKVFVDNAVGGTHTWLDNFGVELDTDQKELGDSSLKIDGGISGRSFIQAEDNLSDFDFSNGKFTIDFWANIADSGNLGDRYLISHTIREGGPKTGFLFQYYYNTDKLIFNVYDAEGYILLKFECDIPYPGYEDSWHHYEVSRNGDTISDWFIFYDGVPKTLTKLSGNWDTTIVACPDLISVGGWALDNHSLKGWMDEVRISKGICRHIAEFVPMSEEYS